MAPSINVEPLAAEALEHYSVVLGCEEKAPFEAYLGSSQKQLSYRVSQKKLECLREDVETTRETARLTSLSLPHASDWLNVVPSPVLGLQLPGVEFRTSVLYRLGELVFPAEGPCVACGAQADRLGDHTVGCAS